jgi:hypothetical protein
LYVQNKVRQHSFRQKYKEETQKVFNFATLPYEHLPTLKRFGMLKIGKQPLSVLSTYLGHFCVKKIIRKLLKNYEINFNLLI